MSIKDGQPEGPQNDQPFGPRPGAYYLGMWSLPFPDDLSQFGHGGDITFQVFRKDQPGSRWIIISRFRHFRTPNGLFDDKDLFRWSNHEKEPLTDAEMLVEMDKLFAEITRTTGAPKPDPWLIQGNGHEFLAKVLRHENPPWFHFLMQVNE